MLGQLRLDCAAEKIRRLGKDGGPAPGGAARACAGFGPCRGGAHHRIGAGGCGEPGATEEEAASIGGAFTLVDQDGHTVTDETYRGKWLLIYFGYTHCPDTCPMAFSNIAAALDQLDPGIRARAADDIRDR